MVLLIVLFSCCAFYLGYRSWWFFCLLLPVFFKFFVLRFCLIDLVSFMLCFGVVCGQLVVFVGGWCSGVLCMVVCGLCGTR